MLAVGRGLSTRMQLQWLCVVGLAPQWPLRAPLP